MTDSVVNQQEPMLQIHPPERDMGQYAAMLEGEVSRLTLDGLSQAAYIGQLLKELAAKDKELVALREASATEGEQSTKERRAPK